ncbi:hypothetical protein P0082_06250 [Candidatus Haliotispira prima]|uniref:Aminoacyl-tRNA synthetase class II (D/K/N) domain-containing protein n=1 Tax=Candidatus Haliotispira prima TaxID=3034016 RepID=A0ABY8ME16_9SPIO|nr:hypothetical protein P0082_06250 [Candidatus Haliotispira prima]
MSVPVSAADRSRLIESRIRQKAGVLRAVRRFFERECFIELDTKILQGSLVPELHVAGFSLPNALVSPVSPPPGSLDSPNSRGEQYLLPSPELAMKNLLCDWNRHGKARSVYQLAHCFRREEIQDHFHFQEFLMLEFYAVGLDAMHLLELLCSLLSELSPLLRPVFRPANANAKAKAPGPDIGSPRKLSFDELCRKATGLGFDRYWQKGLSGMRDLYTKASGKQTAPELNQDDLFHLFLVEFLEPYIRQELPNCVLYPYPDVTPLPAKSLNPNENFSTEHSGGWVDRWELYVNGVELANACREENRLSYLQSYRKRFVNDLRSSGRYAELQKFDLEAPELWQYLPDCSGAALGLDRLLALFPPS